MLFVLRALFLTVFPLRLGFFAAGPVLRCHGNGCSLDSRSRSSLALSLMAVRFSSTWFRWASNAVAFRSVVPNSRPSFSAKSPRASRFLLAILCLPAESLHSQPRSSNAAAGSRLLGLDPRGFDEPHCTFTLALHEACEICLRHAHRLAAVLGNPIAKVRSGEHTREVLRKLLDNSGRSAGRGPYSIPNREVESCDARFSDRRHLSEQSRAPRRRHT